MIKDEVVYMVNRFNAIEQSVLTLYISKYFNISEDNARKAIHKCIVARACCEKDNFIVDKFFTVPNSSHSQMSRAIRVALEFMDVGETGFMRERVVNGNDRNTLLMVQVPATPEAKAVNASAPSQLIQISYIARGDELTASEMLITLPVPSDLRKILRRVAIVEPGFNQEFVRKAGYMMFIRFGRNMYTFTSNDIINTYKETRWDDVKEKVTNITFMTKAEDKCLSVAASSIISRYIFLREIKKLEKKYEITIPLGASDAVNKVAQDIVTKYGKKELENLVKLNFKNTEKVLSNK